MSFEGHQIFKVNKHWIFDLTEFIGYKVHLNKSGEPIKFDKAFRVLDEDKDCNFNYAKYVDKIPVGVLRKTEELIKKYYKETYLYGDSDSK